MCFFSLFGCQAYYPELREVAYATIACVIIYVVAFAVGLGKCFRVLQSPVSRLVVKLLQLVMAAL